MCRVQLVRCERHQLLTYSLKSVQNVKSKVLVLQSHGVCCKEDTIGQGGGVDLVTALSTCSQVSASEQTWQKDCCNLS